MNSGFVYGAKVLRGGGGKDGPIPSLKLPGTWMPAPRGAEFALLGYSKGKHERTYATIMIFPSGAEESCGALSGAIYTLDMPD